MVQPTAPWRVRDTAREEHERRRYELLERIYLLTGTNCQRGVYVQEITEQFGGGSAADAALADDLVRLGLLRRLGQQPHLCITRRGVEFMQRRAWRRRSVRDY